MKIYRIERLRKLAILWMILILSYYIAEIRAKGSVHSCVLATQALATTGDGTDPNSCAGCDPAVPDCAPTCQGYIKKVYYECDSVCLPDGYYFDPQNELSGCFSPNQFQFKIKVERCGCNSAIPRILDNSPLFCIVLCILISLLSLYFTYS